MTQKHTPGLWEVDIGECLKVRNTSGSIAMIMQTHLRGRRSNDETQANARLIAAAPDMLEALQGLQQFFAMPDECSIGRFDRLAEQYRRETGNWAPGKSIPDAYNDSTDCETRRTEYDAWVQSKVDAARAAIARATGEAKP